MDPDLDPLLDQWPYNPSQVNARFITSADGSPKVQLRLDLGILQMHLDGRPDGQRPFGFESWLAYYKNQYNKHLESGNLDNSFSLDSQACQRLQQEAIQFYHRYLALYELKDWHRVMRDTRHNLQIADFLAHFAENEEHAFSILQFKPYIIMMNCRAAANRLLEQNQHLKAIDCVRSAISEIEQFLSDAELELSLEDCPELQHLRAWLNELESTRPISPLERMERQLAQAISNEEYEKAAQLRDQLARLKKQST